MGLTKPIEQNLFSYQGTFMYLKDIIRGWGASLFGGGCFSLVFGLICHAVITLRRNEKREL